MGIASSDLILSLLDQGLQTMIERSGLALKSSDSTKEDWATSDLDAQLSMVRKFPGFQDVQSWFCDNKSSPSALFC